MGTSGLRSLSGEEVFKYLSKQHMKPIHKYWKSHHIHPTCQTTSGIVVATTGDHLGHKTISVRFLLDALELKNVCRVAVV